MTERDGTARCGRVERRARGTFVALLAATLVTMGGAVGWTGEITVTGTITVPGYSVVRTSYTVSVFDDGTTLTTTRSAHARVIVGGERDGHSTPIPARTTTSITNSGAPSASMSTVPARTVATYPPTTRTITEVVPYNSTFELDRLTRASDLGTPGALTRPPGALTSGPLSDAETAAGAAGQTLVTSTALDTFSAGEVDAVADEAASELAGDPVAVSTGVLVLEESHLVLRAGEVEVRLARVHRTGLDRYLGPGSLGAGWFFAPDSRIVLGRSVGAADALAEAQAILSRLTHPRNGPLARLEAAVRADQASLAAAGSLARRALREARELRTALRAVDYNGRIADAVERELSRQIAAAGSIARELEARLAALDDKITALDRLLHADEANRIRAAIRRAEEAVRELRGITERAGAHARRNAGFAAVEVTGSPVRAGNRSLTVIGPDGMPRRYELPPPSSAAGAAAYRDGSANHHPHGAEAVPAAPTTDRLHLQPDGSFVLERRDGTRWSYGFHGELRRMEDRNGNYARFEYDAQERLVAVRDSRGRAVTLDRRQDGLVTAIHGPESVSIVFTYDGGLLRSVTDEVGDRTGYEYERDARGLRVAAVHRPDGSAREYEYALVRGRVRTVATRDEEGATERFDFTTPGRTVFTNPSGLSWVYELDERHRTARLVHPGGLEETFRYDARGNLVLRERSDGARWRYEYDARDNRTRARYPDGSEERWTWTGDNLIRTHRDRRSVTTSYSYDARGNLLSIRYADATSEHFRPAPPGRPEAGAPLRHTNRRGNVTHLAYDSLGFLSEVRDSEGPVATFTRDALGRVVTHTNGAGDTVRYTYRADGRVTVVAGPGERRIRLSYNDRKDLTARDENGAVTRYRYDRRHLLTRVTNPLGEEVRYQYRADGRLVLRTVLGIPADGGSRTSAAGAYQYDDAGHLTAVEQVETGSTTRVEHDAAGRVTAVVDSTGARTEYERAFDGRPVVVRRFVGGTAHEERMRYEPGGPLIRYEGPAGRVLAFEHDAAHRTTTTVSPAAEAGAYVSRGPYGLPLEEVDATGRTRSYRYDLRGRLVEVRRAEHREARYEYDAANRVTGYTDGTGASWNYEYGTGGFLEVVTGPDGAARRYEHDAQGNVIRMIDETGRATAYARDGLGRVVEIAGPYDAERGPSANTPRTALARHVTGEVEQITDPTGRTTTLAFDARGSVVGLTHADGTRTTFVRDAAGRLIRSRDASDRTVSYEYDEAGRLTTMRRAGETVARYRYDPAGRLTHEYDGLGHAHEYRYDRHGRLAEEINRSGGSRRYTRDAAGRVVTVSDYTGIRADYTYDDAGRLTHVNYSDGSWLRYAYDGAGRMVEASNGNERLHMAYDERGRLSRMTGDATGTDLRYTYDAAGRRTAMRDHAAGTRTTYAYDQTGRVARITGSLAGTVTLTHDAAGRLATVTTPNGVTTSTVYDDAGRSAATRVTDSAGRLITGTAHVRDPAGRRRFDVDATGTVTAYEYDPHGRLASVLYPPAGERVTATPAAPSLPSEFPLSTADARALRDAFALVRPLRKATRALSLRGAVEHFRYDAAGNRITHSSPEGTTRYTYDEKGRLAGSQNLAYRYDMAGNLTDQQGPAGASSFTYSAQHRVTRAHTPQAVVSYAYDALGRRIMRIARPGGRAPSSAPTSSSGDHSPLDKSPSRAAGSDTIYRYEGFGFSISSRDERTSGLPSGDSSLSKPTRPPAGRFRPAPAQAPGGSVSSPSTRYAHLNWGGRAYAVTGGTEPLYLSHTPKGSIALTTDARARPVAHYRYDAFGSALASSASHSQPYGYAGKPADPVTGHLDLGYRDYDPAVGRFTTPDPIKAHSNWYSYANADPVNYHDPFGLAPVSDDAAAWSSTRGLDLTEFGYHEDPYRLTEKRLLQQRLRDLPMYQPGAGGNYNKPGPGQTWCNQAAFDYAAATSPCLFSAATGGGTSRTALTGPVDISYNTNANQAAENLRRAAHMSVAAQRVPALSTTLRERGISSSIRLVGGQEAQSLTNQGYTVLAVRPAQPSGHMAVVSRSTAQYDPLLGPMVSHVGENPGEREYSADAFGSTRGVGYYVDSRQKLGYIDWSQVEKTHGYD